MSSASTSEYSDESSYDEEEGPFNFAGLPAELRHMVYKHYYTDTKIRLSHTHFERQMRQTRSGRRMYWWKPLTFAEVLGHHNTKALVRAFSDPRGEMSTALMFSTTLYITDRRLYEFDRHVLDLLPQRFLRQVRAVVMPMPQLTTQAHCRALRKLPNLEMLTMQTVSTRQLGGFDWGTTYLAWILVENLGNDPNAAQQRQDWFNEELPDIITVNPTPPRDPPLQYAMDKGWHLFYSLYKRTSNRTRIVVLWNLRSQEVLKKKLLIDDELALEGDDFDDNTKLFDVEATFAEMDLDWLEGTDSDDD